MVEFGGWDMPVQYTSIIEETKAVRTNIGLFDISHMGRCGIVGPGAEALLDYVTPNDVRELEPGRAQYSLLTNPTGGIVDDIIVYRLAAEEFLVVLNASNTAKDLAWIRSHAKSGVEIVDQTRETAMIAVQGPNAVEAVSKLAGAPLQDTPRFGYARGEVEGAECIFCRTGYTGEDGFELIVPADAAEKVWRALLDLGALSCGLGARDVLRVEAGYPLYGHEIDDTTTPVDAALMWVVKLDKGDFIGRDAIAKVKAEGAGRKLSGLRLDGKLAPRQGYNLFVGDEQVGVVTSGTFSPTMGRSVGMAYVNDPCHKPGTVLEMEVRSSRIPVTAVAKKSLLEQP
jgi:aminomethyltransferase